MSPPPTPQSRGEYGRNGTLSRDEILHAAVAVVDTEGLAQLTMRRVGTVLGVEAMALYRYFPSRRVLLDAMVDSVVSEVATNPETQLVNDDDWTDYLHRLAHGVRRMALTHPRLFPLIATHPTEAPWIRPPIRSLRWVDDFLAGLQDHEFPPPAAATAYKRFSTFLLGHLLLEVGSLGLDHAAEATAPPAHADKDRKDAEALRVIRAHVAERAMRGPDAPDAQDILEATTARPTTIADEPVIQAAELATPTTATTAAIEIDADLPVTAALVSTATLNIEYYQHVKVLAGFLAEDTAAADFDNGLTQLLDQLAELRRP